MDSGMQLPSMNIMPVMDARRVSYPPKAGGVRATRIPEHVVTRIHTSLDRRPWRAQLGGDAL